MHPGRVAYLRMQGLDRSGIGGAVIGMLLAKGLVIGVAVEFAWPIFCAARELQLA